jgi:hypothetical protein
MSDNFLRRQKAGVMRYLLAAFAFLSAMVVAHPARAAGAGLLLLQLDAVQTANHGKVVTSGLATRAYTLMNLETKKVTTNFSPSSLWMVELDEGIYCLYAVRFADNVQFDYCGEPYFRVVAGRVNNAGRWRFGASLADGQSTLIYSMRDLDKTLDEARRMDSEALHKYSPGTN